MTNFLGVDIGRKRIGLSIGSSDLMIALPVSAILVENRISALSDLVRVVREKRIDVIVFGYPINMDGSIGESARYVDAFVADFQEHIDPKVRIIKSDERLTSHQAEEVKKDFRKNRYESAKKKRSNRAKGTTDSCAAAIILQDYFDELSITSSEP